MTPEDAANGALAIAEDVVDPPHWLDRPLEGKVDATVRGVNELERESRSDPVRESPEFQALLSEF